MFEVIMINVNEDKNSFGLILHILTHKVKRMWGIVSSVI